MNELPTIGDSQRSVFLLRRVDVLFSKQSKKYLRCHLVCPLAALDAVVFEHVDVLIDALKTPLLIEATLIHTVQGYQLAEINPLVDEEYDAWDHLAKSPFDEEEMWAETLKILTENIVDPAYVALRDLILSDEDFVKAYKRSPAALMVHHPYRGGLMEHVLSTLKMAPSLAEHYEASLELLTLGLWLHDIGKLWEIDFINGRYSREGEKIGHLIIGTNFLSAKIKEVEELTEQQGTQILHLLVAHHGAVEKGSPRPPMSVEAILVHCLDNLDSEMFQCLRDLKTVAEDSFSARNPLLGKKFYKP